LAAPNHGTLPILEVLYGVVKGNKKAAVCSDFGSLEEPSDGLEPSTPSLPWRIRASATRQQNGLTSALSLQHSRFFCPPHPFLEAPLNLPARPWTCPQDLSPRPVPKTCPQEGSSSTPRGAQTGNTAPRMFVD
jgi:hypothetical protein